MSRVVVAYTGSLLYVCCISPVAIVCTSLPRPGIEYENGKSEELPRSEGLSKFKSSEMPLWLAPV